MIFKRSRRERVSANGNAASVSARIADWPKDRIHESIVDAGSTLSSLPPPSIDLQAEERFRNASLNREKKKEKKVEPPTLVPTPSPPTSLPPFLPNLHPFFLESVLLKDESRGDDERDLLVDETGSWMIAQSSPHIPIGVHRSSHYPPLRFHVPLPRSVSHQNLFIEGSRRAVFELERTPSTVITFIKSAAPVHGRVVDNRRDLAAVPSFTSENGGVVGPDPAIPLAILPY